MAFNILVVDDSEIIRTVIRKAIAISGLEVNEFHEAANGREALEMLQDQWIDIVLTDINMPIMDGVEMIRRMAADRLLQKLPVVIVSTERSQSRIAELLALGVRAYLKKPFRPEDFHAVITDLLTAPETEVAHG